MSCSNGSEENNFRAAISMMAAISQQNFKLLGFKHNLVSLGNMICWFEKWQ